MRHRHQPSDLLSRFVNWLQRAGRDQPVNQRPQESTDPFSKLMNRISG